MSRKQHPGQGRRMPNSPKDYARRLRRLGFMVTPTKTTHLLIEHPDHPGWREIYAATPSDRRGLLNSLARVKRHTGIDVTRH